MDKLKKLKILAKGSGLKPPDWADALYLGEVELQLVYALASYGEIKMRVARGSNDLAMLAYSHMLLVFAGNAAKILFPSPQATLKSVERSRRLRTKLGIAESPPVGLVDARNFVEHFDERMDRYLESAEGMIIHRRITSKASPEIEIEGGEHLPAFHLQLLETATLDLTLFDMRVNLNSLAKEVETIQLAVSKVLATEKGAEETGKT